jgi:signal transduction histidine kinase
LVNITDNGQGFYPNDVMSREASLEHIGLLGMRNRVEMLGGCINIDSSPGNGTSVVFSIPVVSMLTANS